MKRFITVFFIFYFAIISTKAWAINGAQLTGFSPTMEALGGTGASFPQDTSVILSNPAGMSDLPFTANLNVLAGFPTCEANSANVPVNPLIGISPGNTTAGTRTHQSDAVVLPSVGFVVPTPWLDQKLTLGFGFFVIAGFGSDYRAPRVNPLLLGGENYDSYSFFGMSKTPVALSYKVSDKLSLGASIHLNRYQFATNSSLGAAGMFAKTHGDSRIDQPWGWGFGLGILYKPLKNLSLGLSYTSEQHMQEFERYQDILPQGLNYPQQMDLGVTFWPMEQLSVSGGFRWINWSGAGGGLGTTVANGGFGWRDQYIAMLGLQYDPGDWFALRAGYNYGRGAVYDKILFANQLAAVIYDHHVSAGAKIKVFEHFEVNVSYVWTPSLTVVDTGLGTSGAWSKAAIHQVHAGVGFQF